MTTCSSGYFVDDNCNFMHLEMFAFITWHLFTSEFQDLKRIKRGRRRLTSGGK